MANLEGSVGGIIGRGLGFGSPVGLIVTHGFGSSAVTVVSGPFDVVAAEVFVAGATKAEVFNAGAVEAEVFNAGATAAEVVI